MRLTVPAAAACLTFLAACGGGDSSTGPGDNANFTATIDGTAWTAAAATTSAHAFAGGRFTLIGATLDQTKPVVSITLYNIEAPGTYLLGVGPLVRGGTAYVGQGAGNDLTPLSGNAGTVTLTDVSATHIAGSFAFVAGAGAAARNVTNGSFDLPVTATGSIAVAPNGWSTFGGALNGADWNAAGVEVLAGPSSGSLAMGANNDTWLMTITISGWSGPGTYALDDQQSRLVTMVRSGTTQSWGGVGGLSSGTFTVTSETAARITGTYDFTLAGAGSNSGAGALHATGAFSIGLP